MLCNHTDVRLLKAYDYIHVDFDLSKDSLF